MYRLKLLRLAQLNNISSRITHVAAVLALHLLRLSKKRDTACLQHLVVRVHLRRPQDQEVGEELLVLT